MINKHDIISWKNDPITRLFMDKVKLLQGETERIILEGDFLRSNSIDREYSFHIGILDGIDKVLDIELIEESEEDGEISS